MAAPYSGQCLCGAVRYRADAEPLAVYACHCTDCQRRTGSAFSFTVVVARSALQLVAGTTVPYFAELPDGRVKKGQMCVACGTRLWGEAKDRSIVALTHGALEQPTGLTPVAHVFTRSAQPWLKLPEGARHYETQPIERGEIARLWAAAHAG
jgi:hypothetical protein